MDKYDYETREVARKYRRNVVRFFFATVPTLMT